MSWGIASLLAHRRGYGGSPGPAWETEVSAEFGGAAMNWEKAPGLRQTMLDATARLTAPIYFLQAENDYSVAPTFELAAAMAGGAVEVQSRVFPAFGLSHDEGHFFERTGATIWGPEIRRFLERWL